MDNNYMQLQNYNMGSARIFRGSNSTKPVVLSSYGGVGYNNIQQPTGDIATSKIGSYAELGSGYSGQPVTPARAGYQLLNNAYKQTTLFSGPYSARQCIGNN